jgi:DNA-binding SARP family transcriptional activator
VLHSDEEKEAMDEEPYEATLNSLTERISRLENELSELRQLVLLQKPYLTKPIDKPTRIPTNSDLPDSVVAETDCWEVTCLGNFRLRCAGRDLTLCKSRRGQSILKYLLASPGYAASSELLIECFWPQVDPEAGTHSLQVAVHALRRSLHGFGPNGSDETVLFRNNRYFLNPALGIVQDVDRFRATYERGRRTANTGQSAEAKLAFEEARALYTGDYHADCYEEWASSRRLALQDMRLALLSQLGPLYSQGKEWERAVSCYHEILVVDCYREDIYRQLMRCYAACGRQADIKRTYHTCQECLRCDLRLAPAPETTMLYQQLIQQ